MVILSMLLVVALVPLFLWRRYQDSRSGHAHEDEDQVCFSRLVKIHFFYGTGMALFIISISWNFRFLREKL